MNDDTDFSTFNFEYLLKARDLAIKDTETVSALLGIDPELAERLTRIEPKALHFIGRIKQPLFVPHQNLWWWNRLFTALETGCDEEVKLILEQASMITSSVGGDK